MIQLQTFGALDLTTADGQSLEVVLSQPKRALLLAYLACATPRGYHRRDVLVAVFWPELDTERARAALRQALHFLRSSVGDALITRGDEVAVESTLMTSDVADFERAIDEGEFAEALRLYRGDFLPGVFAKDAPDVERWIDAERSRLASTAVASAWVLADRAAETDPAGAAAWAAAAARIAPSDESVLRRRMSLLYTIGERSGALRAYDDFISALQRDYADTEPTLETRDLRDTIARAPVERKRRMLPPAIEGVLQPDSSAPTPAGAAAAVMPVALTRGPAVARLRKTRWGRLAALGFVVAGLGTAVAATVRSGRADHSAIDPTGAAGTTRTVAVMPFIVRGGKVDYLRDGMVDLLSISLDDAGEVRTVEPTALLGYLSHDTASSSDSFERNRAAALRFNAGNFVVGSIVNIGDRLEARAALYATGDSADHPLTVATATSDEAHVVSLVDQLTRGLVAGMLRTSGVRLSQLAAQTTSSLPALKSYLRGTKAMRTGQYDAAIDAFTMAVASDSTFALAFYGLSMARGWASGGTDRQATIAAGRAVKNSAGLSPHDRLLLVAHFDHWNGRVVEAEAEYRRLLAAYPADAEARHELGEVMFHNGMATGHAMSDARDAFTRIAAIDALRISALTHLARIAAIEHDSAAIDSLALIGQAMAPGDPRVAEILTLRTFVTGDSTARIEAVRATPTWSDRELWARVWDVANYAGAWGDAESIAMGLTDASRPRAVRALGWTTIAQLRAAAGRPAAARAAIAQATPLDSAQAAYTRGFLASLPFLPAPASELTAARAALVGWHAEFAPIAEHAETSVSAGLVPPLRRLLLASVDMRLGRAPEAVRGDSMVDRWVDATQISLGALLHPAHPSDDARAAVRSLDRVWHAMEGGIPARSTSLMRLARADLLQATGDNVEADRWYATFPAFGRDDAVFRAWAARGRARAMAARGDQAGALRQNAEAAWLWRNAEPEALALLRAR